jgi:chromosome segregation ATPase
VVERDIDKLTEHNEYLRKRLREEQQQTENLREQAIRWQNQAENHHRSWMRLHSALNLLRQDAMEVLRTHDASYVHRELETEREKNAQLLAKRQQWRDHARRATTAKAEEAQRARELGEVVEELRKKLVEAEEQRDAAVAQAEKVVAERDAQMERYRLWCERWYKGEVGAIEVIAGITADLGGDPMPHVSEIDRRRAVENARVLSLMNAASDELCDIAKLLALEGVPFEGTVVELVKSYIALMNGRVGTVEESTVEERR